MNRRTHGWFGIALLLTAGVAIASPSHAAAAWLGFRNDSGQAVVLQGVNGTRTGVAVSLYPGEVLWEWAADRCVRHITITEARPSRAILFRGSIVVEQGDTLYLLRSPQTAKDRDRGKSVLVVRDAEPPESPPKTLGRK